MQDKEGIPQDQQQIFFADQQPGGWSYLDEVQYRKGLNSSSCSSLANLCEDHDWQDHHLKTERRISASKMRLTLPKNSFRTFETLHRLEVIHVTASAHVVETLLPAA